jgi:hypothetical protein
LSGLRGAVFKFIVHGDCELQTLRPRAKSQLRVSFAPLPLVVSPRQIVAKFARIKISVLTDKFFLSRLLTVIRNLLFAGLRLRA